MLAGTAAVAIWNGITDAGRDEFYAWHMHEHIPERIGIPGFLRGRRYRAVNSATQPEFFTLYEVRDFPVLRGADYAERLNNPTPRTRSATAHFLTTSRALAHVVVSRGTGAGGVLATLRFDPGTAPLPTEDDRWQTVLSEVARMPQVCGAHLLVADTEASGDQTAESRGRRDIEAPPNWMLLLEGCQLSRLEPAIASLVAEFDCLAPAQVGRYLHEFTLA